MLASREVKIMNDNEDMQALLMQAEDPEDEINSRDAEIKALESQLCTAKEALEPFMDTIHHMKYLDRTCPTFNDYKRLIDAFTHTGPCKHEAEAKQTWALAHEESRWFLERAKKAEAALADLRTKEGDDG